MLRRLGIVLAALVSLFVLTACIAPTPTPIVTPTPSPTPTPPNAAAYLEESLAALQTQTSFHFDMDISFVAEQGTLTINIPITFTGDVLTEGKFSGTISVAALGLNLISDIIVTEEGVYVTDPTTGLWELTSDTGSPVDPTEVVSAEFVDFTALALIGREELNGVPVYHLVGRLAVDQLAEQPISARIDYWVGVDDGLPRRIRVDGDLTLGGESEFLQMAEGAIANITMEMDLSDFGKPLVIEAPIISTD